MRAHAHAQRYALIAALLLLLAACTSTPPTEPGEPELLDMVPGAEGFELGTRFSPEGEAAFSYRGRQAGHVVYHRDVPVDGQRWRYTDLMLHVGPGGRINRIVLLKQFVSREEAELFYQREYEAQRGRYRLSADSGEEGSIRFSRVEAYPDRHSWAEARGEHREAGGDSPVAPYYHPIIARRSAIFVYVRGVPTVARIYESHRYPAEETR
ncbi:MAG: hypothetical protein ACOC45_00360 [Alkalispirochaetaceae bacterium]